MTSCLQTVVHTLIDTQKNEKSANSLPRSLPRERRISSTATRVEMPSASPAKYRGSVVRQLSLQSPLQSPPSRGLKKQLSEDDSRTLHAVEVTGQGWGVSERPEPILRISSGDGRLGQGKTGTRPKPVKVAWADRKPENESAAGVAVIATKCKGQPRPASVKTQRLRSPLLGNKDTLVYSRLQLAERLRNAWSEREKMKPNINIFLAHASDVNRSEPATDRPAGTPKQQEAASALSDSAPLDKKRKSMPVRAFSEDFCHSETFLLKENDVKKDDEDRHLQEMNKIEIRMTEIKRGAEGSENKPPETEEVGMKRSRGKPEDAKPEAPDVTAQERRANFRRSSMLHKTITESFSVWPREEEKKVEENLKPKKPSLLRTFSAPSQNQAEPKTSNLQKMKVPRKLQPSVSFDLPSTTEDAMALRDRIKSAPIRKKLKSAAARRKNKDKDSSDEEKEGKESTSGKKSTRRHVKTGGEIVTMVSLVSPAESDTEDSVINLPEESWEGREKEEAAENRNSTCGRAEEVKDSTFVVQKFVSLRKTTKSVTFHPHPILNRSYSASFPSRRAPAGTPIIIPTPVISNPALTPAQLLERDRRPPVFPGTDARGIKRRFLRSSSESPKDDDLPDEKCGVGKSSDADKTANKENESGEEAAANGEPEFKCPKEKECWALYQKMVEKGVSVSFDTVLRGMLTPTEYRLRKNRLLSHC